MTRRRRVDVHEGDRPLVGIDRSLGSTGDDAAEEAVIGHAGARLSTAQGNGPPCGGRFRRLDAVLD